MAQVKELVINHKWRERHPLLRQIPTAGNKLLLPRRIDHKAVNMAVDAKPIEKDHLLGHRQDMYNHQVARSPVGAKKLEQCR